VRHPDLPFVCAWCERVRGLDGRWKDASPADLESPRATHGICPDCLAEQTRAAAAPTEAVGWR
jgi:hypothetical protein